MRSLLLATLAVALLPRAVTFDEAKKDVSKRQAYLAQSLDKLRCSGRIAVAGSADADTLSADAQLERLRRGQRSFVDARFNECTVRQSHRYEPIRRLNERGRREIHCGRADESRNKAGRRA